MSAIRDELLSVLVPTPSEADLNERAKEFWEEWNFPNCIGAIDGKHVRIVCPAKSGSLFYNYKEYFSIVLLAIVDAKYKFLAVDIGSYGKEGDSGIFAKSVMGKKIYDGTFGFPPDNELPKSDKCLPYVIVGDEAFRLHKNIMKPYNRGQAKEDMQKAVFNYRLSRARRVSENAFAHLCNVFRIFFSPIAVEASTVDLIITVAVCLHNLIRDGYEHRSTQHFEETVIHSEGPVRNLIPFARRGGYGNAEGFSVRDSFKEYFNSQGQIAWQEAMVLKT